MKMAAGPDCKEEEGPEPAASANVSSLLLVSLGSLELPDVSTVLLKRDQVKYSDNMAE